MTCCAHELPRVAEPDALGQLGELGGRRRKLKVDHARELAPTRITCLSFRRRGLLSAFVDCQGFHLSRCEMRRPPRYGERAEFERHIAGCRSLGMSDGLDVP